jgi:septal ring factor EnvC (AmiA/AmiB activator)
MKKFLQVWLLIFCILLLQPVGLAANSSESEPMEVGSLVEKIQEAKIGLKESERRKREVLGRLFDINQRMQKISAEKNELSNEMLVLRSNSRNFAQMIVRLEKHIEQQKKRILGRFRVLSKLGQLGYIKVILAESSMADVERSLRFLKIVARKDIELLRNYRSNKFRLTKRRDELRKEVEKLAIVERKISVQENLIVDEHNKKKDLLSNLEEKVRENVTRISRARKAGIGLLVQGKLHENIRSEIGPFFFEKKGHLPHPIGANIEQAYGLIEGPGSHVRLLHKGLSYQSGGESPVLSVFKGEVQFVGQVNGYGNTIIVDHGDSYYTLYARLSKMSVKRGDSLVAGQRIGLAGSDQGRRGLYFEIRHFSVAEDPGQWLVRRDFRLTEKTRESRSL